MNGCKDRGEGGDGDRSKVGKKEKGKEIKRRRFCVGRIEKMEDKRRIRMIKWGKKSKVRRWERDMKEIGKDLIEEKFRINKDKVRKEMK